MNQPHKHKDMIIAWAKGAQIQFQAEGMENWEDIIEPSWHENCKYRIKPEPKESIHTFRIGVGSFDDETFYTFTADSVEEEQAFQSEPDFIGWITDWEPILLMKAEE